jgi:hypothetical protein
MAWRTASLGSARVLSPFYQQPGSGSGQCIPVPHVRLQEDGCSEQQPREVTRILFPAST